MARLGERQSMRVTQASRLNAATVAAPTKRAAGAGGAFATEQSGKTSQAAAPRAAQTIRGIDALLVIQGVGDAASGRAKAARRGRSMLDVLDDIRLDLLDGAVPGATLARLVKLLDERAIASGEPGLDAVLAEIDLRARVELAKLGHPDA